MKKRYVLLLGLGLFVAAFAAGFLIARNGCSRALTDTIMTDSFLSAARVFETLRDLRDGDTNAVFESLEPELDVGIVSLNASLAESPRMKRARNYQALLWRMAQYRAAYPHQSGDTNMEVLVTAALIKAAATTNR